MVQITLLRNAKRPQYSATFRIDNSAMKGRLQTTHRNRKDGLKSYEPTLAPPFPDILQSPTHPKEPNHSPLISLQLISPKATSLGKKPKWPNITIATTIGMPREPQALTNAPRPQIAIWTRQTRDREGFPNPLETARFNAPKVPLTCA